MRRKDKELLDATRPFAVESPTRSWFHVVTSFAASALLVVGCLRLTSLAARLVSSVVLGLMLVRLFILFHDFWHGAILRTSKLARGIFWIYGLLVLTPPKVWRETHNYHHAHNGKIVGSHVGSYPVVTTRMWRGMSRLQRFGYVASRHPATIAFGVLTVFAWGMCLSPFLRDPRRHWVALLPLPLHVGIAVAVTHTFGWGSYALAVALPLAIATASGAYLFYAQHNFPDVFLQPRDHWNYVRAALESSSYMPMGRTMSFFTGNIGYHHVHHLNPSIPFYRLPEAMAAIPELQSPRVTRLIPRDVVACLRLQIWDPEALRMASSLPPDDEAGSFLEATRDGGMGVARGEPPRS